MPESQLFDAVANLVLQSISVWEDLHLYAMTYSGEYNAFWGLLDENLRSAVCRRRDKNRDERRVPFSMNHIAYYRNILVPESFERIRDLQWRKQLKTILADERFRMAMTNLNQELRSRSRREIRFLKQNAPAAVGGLRITPQVACINAAALYNYV
jgi:hypothetical protein